MNKTIGNYTQQSNRAFPVDCETLDYLSKNQAMAEMLGNIAGDKVILRGCQLQNGGLTRTEGYVFLRTVDYPQGEVLHFEGGQGNDLYVEKTSESVNANGYTYADAYTHRCLKAGTGTESYHWADFITLDGMADNRTLKAAIDSLSNLVEALTGEPLGIVKIFAGTTVPTGYLLCDGTAYTVDGDYANLYAAIGTAFNTTADKDGHAYTTTAGYFRVPDLRGRFVVGQNASDTDYNNFGKAGGKKTHRLTVEEMPSHSHTYQKANENVNNVKHDGYDSIVSISYSSEATSTVGGNQAHENRPPYYVLAYIIKAK